MNLICRILKRLLLMRSSGFTSSRVQEQMIQLMLEMGIKDFRVLDAMSQVPRHIFLDEALWLSLIHI